MKHIRGWAVATTATIAVALVTGCSSNSDASSSATPPSQASSSAPSPAPRSSASASASAAAEITGISVEKFTTAEQIAAAYYDRVNSWENQTLTKEQLESDERFSMSDQEFAGDLADPVDKAYVAALFSDDWQDDVNVFDLVQRLEDIHLNALQLYLATSNPKVNSDDKEPYTRHIELDSATAGDTSSGEFVVNARWHEFDNRDQNRSAELMNDSSTDINGNAATDHLVFSNIDGEWKLTNYSSSTQ